MLSEVKINLTNRPDDWIVLSLTMLDQMRHTLLVQLDGTKRKLHWKRFANQPKGGKVFQLMLDSVPVYDAAEDSGFFRNTDEYGMTDYAWIRLNPRQSMESDSPPP